MALLKNIDLPTNRSLGWRKHSSSLQVFVNYGRKTVHNIGISLSTAGSSDSGRLASGSAPTDTPGSTTSTATKLIFGRNLRVKATINRK